MNIRPIRSAADHEQAMAGLMACLEHDPAPGSQAADEADVLATLIEDYEREQFSMERPSPIDAIRFRMDQRGMVQKDLVSFIGSASKVSEVLNGKRALSLPMIRRLHAGLGIFAAVLIASTRDAADTSTVAHRAG